MGGQQQQQQQQPPSQSPLGEVAVSVGLQRQDPAQQPFFQVVGCSRLGLHMIWTSKNKNILNFPNILFVVYNFMGADLILVVSTSLPVIGRHL